MPEAVAAAADDHNFVNGFFSSREATGQKILQNAVLRFADAAAAVAAVADMGAAAAEEQVITPPVTSMPIAGHPDTIAMSHTLIQPGLQWTVVRSFTAHGLYVLTQLAQTTDGVDPTTALIAKTIDLQTPLIDQFARRCRHGQPERGLSAARRAAFPVRRDPLGRVVHRGRYGLDGDVQDQRVSGAGRRGRRPHRRRICHRGAGIGQARRGGGIHAGQPLSAAGPGRVLLREHRGPLHDRSARYQLPDAHQQVAAQYSMLTAK